MVAFIWFSRWTGGGFFGCLKLIFRAIHTHIEALQWSVGLKNAPILIRMIVYTHFNGIRQLTPSQALHSKAIVLD